MSNVALRRAPLTASVLALICLALAFTQEPSRLEFDRHAILAGEFWRLWTAHWVHFSFRHLVLDAIAFILVCAVAEREFGTKFTCVLLMLGMPLLSLGLLLLTPDLVQYRGVSGVATLLAFASATSLWARQPKLRIVLALLGIGWIVKTLIDASEWGAGLSSLPQGIKVEWHAHVIGAAMGWVVARGGLKQVFTSFPRAESNKLSALDS